MGGSLSESKKSEAVVLVHGLWMTGTEMRVLGGRLEEAGFRVRYFRYRSCGSTDRIPYGPTRSSNDSRGGCGNGVSIW